jgi:excisionase family DNA binding protein
VYHLDMTATLELPSPEASREAKAALRVLSPLAAATRPTQGVRVRPEGASSEQSVMVPREAFALFLEILGQMANGNAVTIVPVHAELTTQQAADYLNVSRPYVVQLLESGKLPFRKVGKHRRIMFEDLSAYRKRDEDRRRQVMQELADEAQRHGLGY